MVRLARILLLGVALLASSGTLWATCVDVIGVSGWKYLDSRTIVLYVGSRAYAVMQVAGCIVLSTSQIRFTKTFICPGDSIIVDNMDCLITRITRL